MININTNAGIDGYWGYKITFNASLKTVLTF